MVHHRQGSSSSSPKETVCVLSDRQPVNHKDVVLSVARESQLQPQKVSEPRALYGNSEFSEVRTPRILPESCAAIIESIEDCDGTSEYDAPQEKLEFHDERIQGTIQESDKITNELSEALDIAEEQCARINTTEFDSARTQKSNSDPSCVRNVGCEEHCAMSLVTEIDSARTQDLDLGHNTLIVTADIHIEGSDNEHMVDFEESQELSDTGSLITQAPQDQSIHATVNALSSWMSAIQPRESWYLAVMRSHHRVNRGL